MKIRAYALPLVVALAAAPAPAETPDELGAKTAVAAYNDALAKGDAAAFRQAISDQLFMFNGAFSGDPTKWEAHMYVAPERLQQWSENFVTGAGPHVFTYKVLGVNVRANAALVTTEESGRNKYREWENERITWLVGRRGDQWKVTGFFIRDITNPK